MRVINVHIDTNLRVLEDVQLTSYTSIASPWFDRSGNSNRRRTISEESFSGNICSISSIPVEQVGTGATFDEV